MLVLSKTLSLFQVAANGRLRAGDSAGALAYAERGRAQLLAAVLRLDEAELSPAQHAELQSLRAQIRQREAADESADPLTGVLQDGETPDVPFADPKFWGAWVYYGA